MTTPESEPVAEKPTVTCPSCSTPVGAGERYCEACGADLGASAVPAEVPIPAVEASPIEESRHVGTAPGTVSPCRECGGAVATDGYCTQCGAKAPSLRDHFSEQPAPWVAAVCDRGIRHHRNEDAVALDARPDPGSHAVLVVCDGVSNSVDSDVASLAAARAARDLLTRSSPSGIGTAGARVAATSKALVAAVDAANEAVVSNTVEGPGNPASCTFVAGVLDAGLLVVGWVGDSRAYWLPDAGEAQLLTVDDSFAAEQIAGGVSRVDAENGPQAHAITRWLGVDAPDHTPHTISLEVTTPGWVLVCSDGLWNYSSEARDMGALVQKLDPLPARDPLALAAALVDWANEQGGVDNITAALARIDPVATGTGPAPVAASTSTSTNETARTEAPHTESGEGTHDGNVLS
jgi:serine/threonine protein phosphatase PrpC